MNNNKNILKKNLYLGSILYSIQKQFRLTNANTIHCNLLDMSLYIDYYSKINKKNNLKQITDSFYGLRDFSLNSLIKFLKKDNSIHDLILGEFPLKSEPIIKINGISLFSNQALMYYLCRNLSDKGIAVFSVDSDFLISTNSKRFIRILNESGFSVNALIQLNLNSNGLYSPNYVLITRDSSSRFFISFSFSKTFLQISSG